MRTLISIGLSILMVGWAANLSFANNYAGKKVLFIDSYHEGYEWSDGVTRGIREGFKDTDVELKIFRMDTKRAKAEESKQQAAAQAKKIIAEFQPDVVIASDDNAAKYLVQPYYTGHELPFVFCGINWDASIYGFPTTNITGMVEVAPVAELVDHLKRYAKGDNIGYLAADVYTSKKDGSYYKEILQTDLVEYYAESFEDWKSKFKEIQDKVSVLVIGNNAGISDWDDAEARRFVMENTKIPSGTNHDHMVVYSVISYAKVPEEQGYWSASTALKILDGASPSEIAVEQNRQGNLIIHVKLAEKMGMVIPYETLQYAHRLIE